MMKFSDYIKLAVSIVATLGAGFIGSLFTTPSITGWYAGLVRPDWSPPNWLFAPVWTTLFILMGVSAFLVWKKGVDRRGVRIGLTVYVVQLVLNVLWSVFFFGLHSPGWALIEIVVLWCAIGITIISFWPINRASSGLLVPYILWVSFASYLNYSIYILNR